jgi:hypothetical protein
MARLIDQRWIANWRDSATVYAVGVTILAVGLWWLVGIWPDRGGLWHSKSTLLTVISPVAPFTGAFIAYRLFCGDDRPYLPTAVPMSVVAMLLGATALALLVFIAGFGEGFSRRGWDYLGGIVYTPIFFWMSLLLLTIVKPLAPVVALAVTISWTLLYLALQRRAV